MCTVDCTLYCFVQIGDRKCDEYIRIEPERPSTFLLFKHKFPTWLLLFVWPCDITVFKYETDNNNGWQFTTIFNIDIFEYVIWAFGIAYRTWCVEDSKQNNRKRANFFGEILSMRNILSSTGTHDLHSRKSQSEVHIHIMIALMFIESYFPRKWQVFFRFKREAWMAFKFQSLTVVPVTVRIHSLFGSMKSSKVAQFNDGKLENRTLEMGFSGTHIPVE